MFCGQKTMTAIARIGLGSQMLSAQIAMTATLGGYVGCTNVMWSEGNDSNIGGLV